jgi:hypothetical protein
LVLEVLSVHLEVTAVVLGTPEGGIFETCHNHLGAGHILATVAPNLEIPSLRSRNVVSYVSCRMETGDKTVEHQEMATEKEGNRTVAVDDIDWCVSPIYWLCE